MIEIYQTNNIHIHNSFLDALVFKLDIDISKFQLLQAPIL